MNNNRKAIELTLELHKMIDSGRGDSEEADLIREEIADHHDDGGILTETLNNLSGLLNEDRDSRKSIGSDVELIEGTVRVPVDLPVNQYLYLQDLASDLRGSISQAIQVYIKEGMEAYYGGGSKYIITKEFEHILKCCDWKAVAPALVEELKLLCKQKELENQLAEIKTNRLVQDLKFIGDLR